MDKIFACGCSYSTGYFFTNGAEDISLKDKDGNLLRYGKVTSFSERLASYLKMEHVMLSSPGASNYCIAKQVEYSIMQNPAFILVNFTDPLKFDFIEPGNSLNESPTIKSFVYGCNEFPASREITPVIQSLPFEVIKHTNLPLYTSLSKWTDTLIKVDQDSMIIKYVLQLLVNSKIPFLAVDLSKGQYFSGDYVFSVPRLDLFSKYNTVSDPDHLTENGHTVLAKMLESEAKKKLDKYFVDS